MSLSKDIIEPPCVLGAHVGQLATITWLVERGLENPPPRSPVFFPGTLGLGAALFADICENDDAILGLAVIGLPCLVLFNANEDAFDVFLSGKVIDLVDKVLGEVKTTGGVLMLVVGHSTCGGEGGKGSEEDGGELHVDCDDGAACFVSDRIGSL